MTKLVREINVTLQDIICQNKKYTEEQEFKTKFYTERKRQFC